MTHGTDYHTLKGCVHRNVEVIRDLLLLSGMERMTAHTTAMRMRELADAALRQAVERQAAQTPERETEPAP